MPGQSSLSTRSPTSCSNWGSAAAPGSPADQQMQALAALDATATAEEYRGGLTTPAHRSGRHRPPPTAPLGRDPPRGRPPPDGASAHAVDLRG